MACLIRIWLVKLKYDPLLVAENMGVGNVGLVGICKRPHELGNNMGHILITFAQYRALKYRCENGKRW